MSGILFSFSVTYFVTYGTAITCYAYFVLTKQEYLYPDARDRQYLLSFHKKAKKHYVPLLTIFKYPFINMQIMFFA